MYQISVVHFLFSTKKTWKPRFCYVSIEKKPSSIFARDRHHHHHHQRMSSSPPPPPPTLLLLLLLFLLLC
jgi:hypothetical protein